MSDHKPVVLYSGALKQITADDYLYADHFLLKDGGEIKSTGNIVFNSTIVDASSTKCIIPTPSTTTPTLISEFTEGEWRVMVISGIPVIYYRHANYVLNAVFTQKT